MTIPAVEDLLVCIKNRDKCRKTDQIDDKDFIFAYVRNYCHYSRDALLELAVHDNEKMCIYDLETHRYVSPDNMKQCVSREVDARLRIQWFDETVPQIFVHNEDGWRYIGGYDNLMITNMDTSHHRQTSLKLKW